MNENTPGFLKGSKVSQIVIFKAIWQYSNHKSFLTGLHLRHLITTPYFLNCFAHVLPKNQSKYPYFKYYAGNIVLLTPYEHDLWDKGTEEQRISYSQEVEKKSGGNATADWSRLEEKRDELIKLYESTFPKMKDGIIQKYTGTELLKAVSKLNKTYFDELTKKK